MTYLSSLSKEENKDIVLDMLGGIVFTNPFPEDDKLPHQLSVSAEMQCVWFGSPYIKEH